VLAGMNNKTFFIFIFIALALAQNWWDNCRTTHIYRYNTNKLYRYIASCHLSLS
jgi:hypothetical protein